MAEPIDGTFGWYLLCSWTFSDNAMKQVKTDVKRFMASKEKDDLYYNFINWKKKDREIAVLTMYAYTDMLVPKHFNIIFQLDNPAIFIETDFFIRQVVINGWTATNRISKGHKHIAIVEFSNSIPSIFALLSDIKDYSSDKKHIQLAFCDKEHFESIKVMMKQRPV